MKDLDLMPLTTFKELISIQYCTFIILSVVGGGGLLFFRTRVKGVIEFFCDARGGAGHFVQLLIQFCQPTPGHK